MKTIILPKSWGVNIAPFIEDFKAVITAECRSSCEFSARKFSFPVVRDVNFPQTFADEFSGLYSLCREKCLGIEIRKMRKIGANTYLYHVIIS